MKFLERLEKFIRPVAIPNLTIGIIMLQVFVYLLLMQRNEFGSVLTFDARMIFEQRQVWRLFSFLFIPPSRSLIFVLISWAVFYMIGNALEQTWGIARYNLYLLVGYLAFVSSALMFPGTTTQNWMFYSTVFLAFAHLFPDFTFLLFFVLPIKVRWLALLQWLAYGYQFLSFLANGQWQASLLILASVSNFLLFFGPELVQSVKGKQQRRIAKAQQNRAAATPRHTCSACNATNLDDPKLEFRYCSQCEGHLCYCMDHLRDHEHIVSDSDQTNPIA